MSFKYNEKRLNDFLILSELFNRMQKEDIKELIESFSFFYNESKFGPNCSYTKKTYLLLEKNPAIDNIFKNLKKLSHGTE